MRRVAVTFVVVLVLAALWATVLLIYDLIKGDGRDGDPERAARLRRRRLAREQPLVRAPLLADGRRRTSRPLTAAAPCLRLRVHPADGSGARPAGWRPVFLDYLHLGFTNATAFSPTDVMPLTLRAKYTMVVQSSVALALFGLIVARAVNTFN